ncbi:MAG TPA: ABC transporter ATP-binding protein [Candidatus Dormibacteraeota bacterium]|nr:ABC transporter ATP-binding protein [Candidatus Dormibacteraeota bacterium]
MSTCLLRVYDTSVTALLDVRGLTVEVPTTQGWVRPVNEVSLEIAPGETLGLVGESGSGKTMLSLALMGLLPAGTRTSGEAWLMRGGVPFGADRVAQNTKQFNVTGQALVPPQSPGVSSEVSRKNLLALTERQMQSVRGREIAMVFQEPMTSLNPVMRVGAQIAEAIRAHDRQLTRAESAARVLTALERAAVPNPKVRARQYPHQLSGGLRQRVMIAMSLAASPHLLIADEPTTALDVTVQKQILELLGRLRHELGLGMLFITHDLGVVAQVADQLAVMYAGRIVEHGPAREVLAQPRHPYTQGLLSASPRLKRSRLKPIVGNVPRLDALPPGCAFEPRCPLRLPECVAAVPELRAAALDAQHETSGAHRARCVLV